MTLLLVGHPSPPVAEGLAGALSTRLGVEEVRATSDAEAFIEIAHAVRPAVAVVDCLLLPGRLLDLCASLSKASLPLLVLTRDRPDNGLELLTAGARGIVEVGEGLPGLDEAVRVVMAGHVHVPAHLLGSVLHDLIVHRREERTAPQPALLDRLSPREREVLGLLASGADHLQIASRLTIAPSTAKTHITRVLAKLDVRSRVEAAALAIAHGLAAPDNGDPT